MQAQVLARGLPCRGMLCEERQTRPKGGIIDPGAPIELRGCCAPRMLTYASVVFYGPGSIVLLSCDGRNARAQKDANK